MLILVTFGAYSSVIHNGFVNFDDGDYLVQTPQVRQGFNPTFFRWAFTTFAQSNWHPLTWLSYGLDYEFFSLKPVGVHIENVFIHALTAVFLFLLLQDVTANRWRSLAVGALYALHPLNVESVAWAAERKTVLCMFFFMLTLWAWSRYTNRRTTVRYLVVVGAFTLGLLAKPQIVALPFILVLWDIWPLKRLKNLNSSNGSSLAELILEKVPLFILSAASSIVTIRAQAAGGAMSNVVMSSFATRVENAVIAYVRYLGHAIWPVRLAVLYPYPVKGFPAWQVVAATFLLLTISILAFFLARTRLYLVIGWLWFLGTLFPVIGLVQVGHAAMADRYACLPLIGLFLIASWGISELANARTIPNAWVGTAAGIVLMLLAVATYRQVGYWQDGETLWTHTLEVTKDNFVAEDNLGAVLVSKGRGNEALQHFFAALAMEPRDPIGNLYTGIYEGERGNDEAAVDHLTTTLKNLGGENTGVTETAYDSLGEAFRNIHHYAESRKSFEAAFRINPDDTEAEIGIGLVADQERNYSEAVHWYADAMRKDPSPVTSLLLANAYRENGQPKQSVEAFHQAEALSKDFQATMTAADRMLISIQSE